ncbi:MAG: hypothetical protein AAF802_11980 [Planctomycetota bacterium]
MSSTTDSKLTLSFECDSGRFDARGFEAWASRLETVRDAWAQNEFVDRESKSQFTARLPSDLSFLQLPEWLLLSYEQHREASDLGAVFRIANGLHDWIDALVVLGKSSLIDGVEAIFRVCCDPFHNELNRAVRGSKPRLYFADEASDNDRLHSLRTRLSEGGYGNGLAEGRWAAIVDGDHPRSVAVLQRLNGPEDLQRAVSDESPRLLTIFSQVDHPPGLEIDHESLAISKGLADFEMILSTAGLLPAAFLGLDCIQLLVGAANVNEHFWHQPYSSNLVLQFIAARLVAMQCTPADSGSAGGIEDDGTATLGHAAAVTTTQSSLRPLVRWFADVASMPSLPAGPVDGPIKRPYLAYLAKTLRTDELDREDDFAEVSEDCLRLILPTIDFRPLGEWLQLELISRRMIREMTP